MNRYSKPTSKAFPLSASALTTVSFQGGEIGGTTDRFNSPRRRTVAEENEEEEW